MYIYIDIYLFIICISLFIYLFIATRLRPYVTVVMYLHVSAMSVESRCFPQFLLRSLGGILGDSSLHQQRVPQCLLWPRGRPQLQSELGPRQMLQDASTPTENSASGLGASDEFSSSLEGKLMLDVAI